MDILASVASSALSKGNSVSHRHAKPCRIGRSSSHSATQLLCNTKSGHLDGDTRLQSRVAFGDVTNQMGHHSTDSLHHHKRRLSDPLCSKLHAYVNCSTDCFRSCIDSDCNTVCVDYDGSFNVSAESGNFSQTCSSSTNSTIKNGTDCKNLSGFVGAAKSCFESTISSLNINNMDSSSSEGPSLHALLTAPTKFKPLSSRRGPAANESFSRRMSRGGPSTPKRQCVLQPLNSSDRSSPEMLERPDNGSPYTPTSNLKLLTRIASMDDSQLQILARKALFHKDRCQPQALVDKIKQGTVFSRNPSTLSECFEFDDDENQDPKERDAILELDNVLLMLSDSEKTSITNMSTSSLPGDNLHDPQQLTNVCSTPSSDHLLKGGRKRQFSNFFSSLDGDEHLESGDPPLVSPDTLIDDVFADISGSSIIAANTSKTSDYFSNSNSLLQSSTDAAKPPSNLIGNKCVTVMHGLFRSDSGASLETNDVNSSINFLSQRSSSITTDGSSCSRNDFAAGTLLKHSSELSRRDKSLGLLGERFLEVFPVELLPSQAFRRLVLDEVAAQLGTERRRIYDIVNVLESLGMATKVGKNVYEWSGSTHLCTTLSRLRGLGERLGLPALMSALHEGGHVFRFPAVCAGGGVDVRREKSLGIICQKLLMLLLAAPQPKVVSMETAVQIIVCGDSECSPTKAPSQSIKRTYSAMSRTSSTSSDYGCNTGSSASLLSPCVSNSSKQEQSAGGGSNVQQQQQRARGRRMYDIANVLSALGLLTRLPASRALQYTGPLHLPDVGEDCDLDFSTTCQRQSLLRNRQPSATSSAVKSTAEGRSRSVGRVPVGSLPITPSEKPRAAAVFAPTQSAVICAATAKVPKHINSRVVSVGCGDVSNDASANITNMTVVHVSANSSKSGNDMTADTHINDNINDSTSPSVVPSAKSIASGRELLSMSGRSCSTNNLRTACPVAGTSSVASGSGVLLRTACPVTGTSSVASGSAVLSHTTSSSARRCRLPRISSESALTAARLNKTTSLFEVAELELTRLHAEEARAREKEQLDRMKQLQYLVSPVYCRKMNSNETSCVVRSYPPASRNSVIGNKTTFAVPTRAPPRSPLLLCRPSTVTASSTLKCTSQPPHQQLPQVKTKTLHQQQQPQLHLKQQTPLIITQNQSEMSNQMRSQQTQQKSERTKQHVQQTESSQQQRNSLCSSSSISSIIRPFPLSLFRSTDGSKIYTLNKLQSVRFFPQLSSPRVALTFPPETPVTSECSQRTNVGTARCVGARVALERQGSEECEVVDAEVREKRAALLMNANCRNLL